MVTDLATFRAANHGQDTQTVSIALRGTDGTLYVIETDPATGALPVTIISGASGIATETTLAAILAQLDVDLSTRASEVTSSSILAKLDVALSTRASQTTVASILSALDVALSTRASESTLSTLNGKVTADIGAPSAAVRVVESGLSKAETPIRRDCSIANLNTGSWTEILASSATANTEMHFYNGTGYSIQLAFGAGGAEVLQYIVPPGGEIVRLLVPNATRISLQPYVNITDGEIVINFLK